MYRFTDMFLLCVLLSLLLGGCAATSAISPMSRLGALLPERITGNQQQSGPVTTDAALQARFDAAVEALRAGEHEAAAAEFEQLAQSHSQLAGPHINLAIIYIRQGRTQDAGIAANEAIKRNPKSAPAYNLQGIVFRQQGKFTEAEQAYRAALANDPGYAHAWRNLGVLYDLYLQQPHEALAAYQRFQALALQPDKEVAIWISDLTRRFGDAPRAAQARQP